MIDVSKLEQEYIKYAKFKNDEKEKTYRNQFRDGPENTPDDKKTKNKILERIVDYDLLMKTAREYNERRYVISKIVDNEYAINNFKEGGGIELFDAETNLKCINNLAIMPRDATLLFLKSIIVDKPIGDIMGMNIDPAILPISIKSPKKFTFGNVQWMEGLKRPIATYRYINNVDVGSIINTCRDYLHRYKKSGGTHSNIFESKLYLNYVNTVLNQTRSVNLSRLTLSLILFAYVKGDSKSKMKYYDDEINPGIYYLQQLFENCSVWPFLDTVKGMRWIAPNGISTQIPLLMYSIINRSISWSLGVISTGFFNLCMHTYYDWASTSFDDKHLTYKSKMNRICKLLNEKVKKCVVLTFDNVGITGTREIINEGEFWVDGEKEEMLYTLKNIEDNKLYYMVINWLLNDKQEWDIDTLASYRMALECVTNPSTYKKSSPVLEYDRSAGGKIENPIIRKHPRLKVGSFVLENRYEGVMRDMYNELMKNMSSIQEGMRIRNHSSEFYNRLTNNSAGITQSRIRSTRASNPLLKALPEIPYGRRYVSALIDNEILNDKSSILASQTEYIKAGKREQNDRRSRWIMMVSNPNQVTFSIALSFTREYQKFNKYIASGKQSGNIKDMLSSLQASSRLESICSDNDITAMDLNTQEPLVMLVLLMTLISLDNVVIDKFFYAASEDREVIEYDENGMMISSRMKRFNAIQIFVMDMVSNWKSNSFEFTEGIFGETIRLSATAFTSGAFHTAGQHNTVLGSLLQQLIYFYINMVTGMTVNGGILGDDLTLELAFLENSEKSDEKARNFIYTLREKLYEIGYMSDPEAARWETTFLQQTSLFGTVKPKHARLSVICAEGPNGRDRNPFEQISELGDILDEMSARCPCPENSKKILNSLWIVNRFIYMNKTRDIRTMEKISRGISLLSERNRNYFVNHDDGITIIIPYNSIFLPEINGLPLPPFVDATGHEYVSSFYTPRGTITEWLFFRLCLKMGILENEKQKTIDYQKRVKEYTNKISKGMMTEEEATMSLQRDFGINVESMIDNDILSYLGIPFGQWLFKSLISVRRLDKEVKTNPAFSKLIEIGRNKQDQNLLSLSYIGKKKLEERNITLPNNILYYNQPKVRIAQAIETSVNDNVLRIDAKFINKVLGAVNNDLSMRYKFKDLQSLGFKVIETGSDVEYSFESKYIYKQSVSCCVNNKSDCFRLQTVFGLPFSHGKSDQATDILKNVLPVSSDSDLIMEIAIRVYLKEGDENDLVNLFMAVGVPPYKHKTLIDIVRRELLFGSVEYQSIRVNRKYFYVATDLLDASRYVDIGTGFDYRRKWSAFTMAFARDYMLAFPQTVKKIKLSPVYDTLRHLSL